jgi:hypothetical protein
VLNLCSSTTPMALEQVQIPELKRFTFFVSRRREEGRERFRLHMGYFSNLEEAQEWLAVVRDIYPGAWAGETPGKKLRERAAGVAPQPQPPPAVPKAAPVQPTARTVVQAGASVNRTVASAANAAVPNALMHGGAPINVPTLQAAAPAPAAVPLARPANAVPAAQRAPVAAPKAPAPVAAPKAPPAATRPPVAPARSTPQPSPVARTNAAPAARVAAPAAASTNTRSAAPSRNPAPAKAPPQRAQAPAAPKAAAAPKSAPAAPRSAPAIAPKPVPTAPAAARAQSPAPQAAAARPAAAKPVIRAGSKTANKALPSSNVREVLAALDEPTGETRLMPSPALVSPSDDASLTDTQVLRFLETRREDSSERPDAEVESGSISLLKPDDTGTRRALKEAVVQNAPVSFAVQLQWSVQPVELEKVPPLAIFSAYTLYTVEGSRDGRKWYGLRLGFFTDAISAKQVAYYVRSEFASVAVVPVSPQERGRASEDEQKTAGLSFPKKTRQQPVDEFKLIDAEEKPALPLAHVRALAAAKPTAAAQPAANKRAGRVRAREQRSPQTLEETLEILGASELEIDNGRGETLNDSGVRHLRVEIQKNTPFRRLIERLSERVRKP